MPLSFEAFSVAVDDATVADLRDRLARTRWPDQIDGAGWDYGTERGYLQQLCAHWKDSFDWRAFEERANAHPQFLTEIDGQRIHFIHARSPEPGARPLLMTHGWPGSVAEFFDVIGPLADPVAHGGNAADAFHVVCPSLPGYGFSGPTRERGWDANRIAAAFAELMPALGYDRFFAQGGDWGSLITSQLGAAHADRVAAIHLNLLTCGPPKDGDPMAGVTESEQGDLARMKDFAAREAGYQAIQSTKPQTLAYGLTDSPAGLAGWIVEKFNGWSDCADGDVQHSFTIDRVLDNISVYWITGTINSSIRLYYEVLGPYGNPTRNRVRVPVGHAAYPAEIYKAPRAWAEAAFDIVHWAEMPRGGHFAAMEAPDLFVPDVRACFRDRALT